MSSEFVNPKISPEQQIIRKAFTAGSDAVQQAPDSVVQFRQGDRQKGDGFLYKQTTVSLGEGEGTLSTTAHEPRFGPRKFSITEVALTAGEEKVVILDGAENGNKKGGVYVNEKLVTDPKEQVLYARKVYSAADSLISPQK